MCIGPAARTTLVNGRIVDVEVSFFRKLPAASPQSLAIVLDRRATECAGRCCAPEPEWSVRARCGALLYGLVIHGPGSRHCPASVQF